MRDAGYPGAALRLPQATRCRAFSAEEAHFRWMYLFWSFPRDLIAGFYLFSFFMRSKNARTSGGISSRLP